MSEVVEVVAFVGFVLASLVWGYRQERQHRDLVRKQKELEALPERRFQAIAHLYEKSNRRIDEHITSRHSGR